MTTIIGVFAAVLGSRLDFVCSSFRLESVHAQSALVGMVSHCFNQAVEK